MDDIYNILAKHFLGETTIIEKKAVFEFKSNNPVEFKMLSELWNKDGIEIHEFDSAKAWNEFKRKIENKPKNIIPRYKKIHNIAAAIAFLLITAISIIYFYNGFIFSDEILVENESKGSKQIELIDGTEIWISRNSSLSYSEEFVKNTREVYLEGKAFFKVSENKNHPFIVYTDNLTITVLGTSFNINSAANKTNISVKAGKVLVESQKTEEKIVLNPNQSATLENEKLTSSETTYRNYLSWMTGIFEFNNTPITDVIADLNTYYNNRLILDQSFKYDCNLTAKFDGADLKQVIEIIETTCVLKTVIENNQFIIKKK